MALLALEFLSSLISKEDLSAKTTMLMARIIVTEPKLIEFLNPDNLVPEKIRKDVEN